MNTILSPADHHRLKMQQARSRSRFWRDLLAAAAGAAGLICLFVLIWAAR
jgi:hypothetical protein